MAELVLLAAADPLGGNQGQGMPSPFLLFKHYDRYALGIWAASKLYNYAKEVLGKHCLSETKALEEPWGRGDGALSLCPIHFLFSLLHYPQDTLFWNSLF